ncbi:DNA polymerase III subunit chi [Shewanella oneidensis MR-1]|uniref:DNA polymerase III chi subunit HolC n=1 Tax=Shewanella oneidensis (strain ATCC 700550 / JCM 31522 / CIP 106686 / LMG 19005 / NCIMB 14063 / MR-1) TaxID=211586 RepID=Q8EBS6_SHEON|nr:DNA polymerase III subunit chi [Shewanella oneidensis]AAN56420.1 DNA polymerase III chi subunit HolC [Shewanella oneidensis MR-1]MDX5999169.1 DNA polymerase III subunit chi [Shewanella oneidensis]MEE2028330.1 DNA polymerase III subunit chi [Shewanella oneidensis]QKG97815.1 DNA polymerase III subunit chi [Shewanella oneidensis MR-1]
MTQALFYLMPPTGENTALSDLYQLACRLSQRAFIDQQQVYIHCQDKNVAFEIDELLWQFDPSAFVPHNLKGEGPTTGSPVEIGFDRLGPNKSRQLLINLADQVPPFAVNFGQIFDFVANDDQHKVIARERYRQYRGLGIELTTQNLATHPLNLV